MRSYLRLELSLAAGTIVIAVLLTAVVLRMPRGLHAMDGVSIGPASWRSASVGTHSMRSDGMSLEGMLATAYDVPAVRLIGPSWLAETCYSLKAVVGVDESDAFRSLLHQELKNRLHLETHFEVRPFDVFVLTATGAPRARKRTSGFRIETYASRRSPSSDSPGRLQSILGKPVIDETGITGWYNLSLDGKRAVPGGASIRQSG